MARKKKRKEKKKLHPAQMVQKRRRSVPDADGVALDIFRRLYCSREAGPVPESQAPAIIHLNKLMRALYQTDNDELVATFGDKWK